MLSKSNEQPEHNRRTSSLLRDRVSDAFCNAVSPEVKKPSSDEEDVAHLFQLGSAEQSNWNLTFVATVAFPVGLHRIYNVGSWVFSFASPAQFFTCYLQYA